MSSSDTQISAGQSAGAEILAFPLLRNRAARTANSAGCLPDARLVSDIHAALLDALGPDRVEHVPTVVAAAGAAAGFAAQQSILAAGNAAWTEPERSSRLDRLLIGTPGDGSLWAALAAIARDQGVTHLPDPARLLAATIRCRGTPMLGRITLPLEYRLLEQPLPALVLAWAPIRAALIRAGTSADAWPLATGLVACQCLARSRRALPVHVGVRIAMQAALSMALIEPRQVPGALTRAI